MNIISTYTSLHSCVRNSIIIIMTLPVRTAFVRVGTGEGGPWDLSVSLGLN